MENIQEKSIFDDFVIDDEAKSNFTDIARWANLNAIIGFISLGVSFIAVVTSFIKLSGYGGAANAAVMGGSGIGFIIAAVVSLLLNITLLQAATNIKKAVEINEQAFLGKGITKLAAYFRIYGILLIIALVFIVLAFLFSILLSAGRAI